MLTGPPQAVKIEYEKATGTNKSISFCTCRSSSKLSPQRTKIRSAPQMFWLFSTFSRDCWTYRAHPTLCSTALRMLKTLITKKASALWHLNERVTQPSSANSRKRNLNSLEIKQRGEYSLYRSMIVSSMRSSPIRTSIAPQSEYRTSSSNCRSNPASRNWFLVHRPSRAFLVASLELKSVTYDEFLTDEPTRAGTLTVSKFETHYGELPNFL